MFVCDSALDQHPRCDYLLVVGRYGSVASRVFGSLDTGAWVRLPTVYYLGLGRRCANWKSVGIWLGVVGIGIPWRRSQLLAGRMALPKSDSAHLTILEVDDGVESYIDSHGGEGDNA
jgi:hypothetical protein